MMSVIVKTLFVLFFIYTAVYLCQIGAGLCVSVYKLAEYKKKTRMNQQIFSNDIAEQIPVSIIIPAYNEASCIVDTIESLLHEDYPNLEIIVVNDGSTDKTEQLLVKKYKFRKQMPLAEQELETKPILRYYHRKYNDKKLVFVCKENGGKADSLNCGLNLCSSPLCVMLDADTKVKKGSVRIMASHFMMNPKTIVCAGSVGSEDLKNYPKLSLFRKALVMFQMLEYYRTFYMQRIMFDNINANVIVSGAFAMFDSNLVKKAGGYQVNTIGEDMELTMRLHAFCASQNREYHIAYAPEANCVTQLPFRYRDYYQQRRRWHIGMLQSMKLHTYMIGNRQYGWAGIMSGTFIILYELLAPFLEVLGLATLIGAGVLNILHFEFTIKATVLYALIIILVQAILVKVLRQYEVEKINGRQTFALLLVSILEPVFFHPLNVIIKIMASITRYRYKKTWKHIQRIVVE